MPDTIEYLAIKKEFKVNDINNLDAKNLAVTSANKDDMSRVYPKEVASVVSNADMLSQNFGGGPVLETPVENVQQNVQVSPIPSGQNTINLEESPVDLSITPSVQPMENAFVQPIANSSAQPMENTSVGPMVNSSVQPMENSSIGQNMVTLDANQVSSELKVPVLENSNLNLTSNTNDIGGIPNIEPIPEVSLEVPNNSTENDFKVSNELNIFDKPAENMFNISEEDINKPIENENDFSQASITNSVDDTAINEVQSSNNNEIKNNDTSFSESINDDIILAQIAIEESNVKHYEALAENSKKKIELLKRQVKNVKKEETNLENTASNLFNNDGVLDAEKVLEKVPFPNLMAS